MLIKSSAFSFNHPTFDLPNNVSSNVSFVRDAKAQNQSIHNNFSLDLKITTQLITGLTTGLAAISDQVPRISV